MMEEEGFSIEKGTTYQKIQIPKEDSLLIWGLRFASLEKTNVATLDHGCFLPIHRFFIGW